MAAILLWAEFYLYLPSEQCYLWRHLFQGGSYIDTRVDWLYFNARALANETVFLESQLALDGYDFVSLRWYHTRYGNISTQLTLSIARIGIENLGVYFWLYKSYPHAVTVMLILNSCGLILSMGKTNHLLLELIFYRPSNNSIERLFNLSASLDEFNGAAGTVLSAISLPNID